jgi:hypothetical protein
LVLGGGKAMRYGIGVGREGFTWAGREKISKMSEWPDWHPASLPSGKLRNADRIVRENLRLRLCCEPTQCDLI